MDVPVSADVKRRRKRKRLLVGFGGVLLLALVTLGLAQLKPAAPLVDKSSIWMDTVKRGEMLRQVRGNGTLTPEDIRWIPTLNAGRVERILVLPGARVKADTVLVELSNPEVQQTAFDSEWQLKGAEAELVNLRVQLKTDKLTQKKGVAAAEADSSSAELEYEVDDALAKSGLAPAVTLKQAKTKADELAKLLEIERERLDAFDEAAKAQIDVHEAKVSQLRAQLDLKLTQVEALKIRAGMDGVLQRLGDPTNPLQLGQQLVAGAAVARVANMTKLKAAIKIPETQAKDVQLDQLAEVDTRNGVIPGHVMRIDPAVENGTVTVDVALDAALPKGARPDLSVDGTIQLERLENVLYVGRPVQGQPDSQVGLFKIVDAGRGAVRVPVKLGRSSVTTIEVVEGLSAGDQIILSDMSQWDAHERVRLN
ncbi:Efflux transporter, RND family, MFP subunit [Verrucomicrobia bacterium]|nr:Efflux transporter, RND family, MFP subunit [Verrucomicrobiota bacterium]